MNETSHLSTMDNPDVFSVAIDEKLTKCVAKLATLDNATDLKHIHHLKIIIDKQVINNIFIFLFVFTDFLFLVSKLSLIFKQTV